MTSAGVTSDAAGMPAIAPVKNLNVMNM